MWGGRLNFEKNYDIFHCLHPKKTGTVNTPHTFTDAEYSRGAKLDNNVLLT